MATKIYQYGLTKCYDDEKEIVEMMFRKHRYQNDLVAEEKSRREQRNELTSKFLRPGLDERLLEIEEEIEAVRAQQREANSKARTKGTDKREVRATLKPLKAEQKLLRLERRAALKEIRESDYLQEQLSAIDHDSNERGKVLRANCGVYWGTYLLAEEAVKAAKKKPELRFHRWEGAGSIGVQIQGGLPTEDLFGDDTRIRIEPIDPAAWLPTTERGDRKRMTRTTLSIRVGSNPDRTPIWARFRMHFHRELPEGRIKRVNIHRKKIGARYVWNADFIVEFHTPELSPIGPDAAIDVGWRKVENGLRVAALVDQYSHVETLILPESILGRFRKVEDLTSIRKLNFNREIASLREFLKSTELPEWLSEKVSHIHQWESQNRLAGLCFQWRDNRFKGDEEVFESLQAWRRQDKHLWDWEANERHSTQLARREIYRIWTKGVAERYGRVMIEKLDLRVFDRLKPAEDDDGKDSVARIYRRDASLSYLIQALKESCSNSGTALEEVDPAWTTLECHSCGVVDSDWDPIKELRHSCSACGVNWDQDVNAAQNLLARGTEVAKAPDSLALA